LGRRHAHAAARTRDAGRACRRGHRGRCPFTDTYEFSVEIDPNEMDADRLDALAAAGMNRASIGVQDFDDEIQSHHRSDAIL
jgi:radical SAM superfamily enzyme YgiQ (UPF0313 family)